MTDIPHRSWLSPENMLIPVQYPAWKNRLVFVTIALLGAYLLMGGHFLYEFFGRHTILLAGLLLTPYLLVIRKPGEYSRRYGWLSLSLLFLSLWIPIRTLYFVAIASAGLFAVESLIGKINHLPCFLFVVLSPVFNFFTTLFGFPIRLRLSDWAGTILRWGSLNTQVAGNIITVDGTVFSVDPACVGLNMLVVSLLISLLLMAYHERKARRALPFFLIGLALVGTLALNIMANLTRIVLLVLFRVMPENPLHDVLGLLCLVGYVIIPLCWLTPLLLRIKLAFRHPFTLVRPVFQRQTNGQPFSVAWLHGALLLLALGRGWTWEGRAGSLTASAYPGNVPGYQREVLESGVYKFSKKEALLYVKPVAEFYDAEHTPLICWRGSGYEFKQIGRQRCADQEIYTGILQKGKDRIYTAWWFDNGQHKTISQADWRWRMGQGEPDFSLVNVNCSTQETLLKEVNRLLRYSLFH